MKGMRFREGRESRSISIIGCGFVGLPLARSLVRDGWIVRGSTTTEEKIPFLETAGIEAYRFDVTDLDSASAGPLTDSDIVVVNIPPGRRDRDRRNAYSGWMARLSEAIDAESRTIFVSSTSVLPDVSRVVDEDDATADAGGSAASLLEAENTFLARIDSVVVRFGGLYGYERTPGRFFAGRTDVPGGGVPVNMIHRDDSVAALRFLIEQPTVLRTFNACAPIHPTRAEFYVRWARRAGLEAPTFDSSPKAFKIVSCERLRRIGFTFAYPDPLMPAP